MNLAFEMWKTAMDGGQKTFLSSRKVKREAVASPITQKLTLIRVRSPLTRVCVRNFFTISAQHLIAEPAFYPLYNRGD